MLRAKSPRPFRRADLPGRAVPFLVSAVATLLVLLVDTHGSAGSGWRVLAGALVTASVLLPVLVAWERLPRAADLLPPALFVAAGTVLLAGDHAPDVIWVPAFLVPLFWLALHHPHGHLLLGLVVSGACVFGAYLGGAQVPGESTGSLILLAAVVCALTLTASRIVSQQRAVSERLTDAATHDPLTGVANRRALDEVLTAQHRERRRERPAAVRRPHRPRPLQAAQRRLRASCRGPLSRRGGAAVAGRAAPCRRAVALRR